MEADKFFWPRWVEGGWNFLAFQHSLTGKEASTIKTEKVHDKTAAPSVGSVNKDFKISG